MMWIPFRDRWNAWLDQWETPASTLSASERVQSERIATLQKQWLTVVEQHARLQVQATRLVHRCHVLDAAARQAVRANADSRAIQHITELQHTRRTLASVQSQVDQLTVRMHTLQETLKHTTHQLQAFRQIRPTLEATWTADRLIHR